MRRTPQGSPVHDSPGNAAVLALIFVTSAFVLTLGVRHVAARAYFILFVPAVMFSTWFGGRTSGMLASALTVVATVFLLPPAELADQFAWLIVAGVVTVGTSILTDARRRAEAQLAARAEEERSRRQDAESLSQLKTDVLVQVAHELRQPLSAISTAVRLLDTTAPAADRQRALAVVGRQTDHLRLLIEDLLDLSRLSRQQLQLRKSTIDVCEVVEDSVTMVAGEMAARRIDLRSSLPACPVHVTADPTRVRQILSNLLYNAVKFTSEGGRIELAVEHTAAQVLIRIRDTGRGIAPDHLPHVFDLFQKGDGEGAGLGIGLAVVKALTEMHGGTVEVRSDGVGHGSEFVVTLPAIAEEPAA
jgi:signal transduction histidine kinase